MATIDGANALGIGDRVGSLTPGKRADLILVRTTDLNMAPLTEPVRMIVQSAQPANVDLVMVDDRIPQAWRRGSPPSMPPRSTAESASETINRVRAVVKM